MEERSAGAVVFRETDRGRTYLLLENAGRWDFPKGGVEEGETELDTVVREVGEETGLKALEFMEGFRKVIEYYYRRDGKNIHKQVVYLLAMAGTDGVKISFEHQGYGWFPYGEAVSRASYGNSKMLLREAQAYLGSKQVRTGLEGEARRVSPL